MPTVLTNLQFEQCSVQTEESLTRGLQVGAGRWLRSQLQLPAQQLTHVLFT